MEEFIGNVNTMWGVIAVTIFSIYKIIDYLIKNSHNKRNNYVLKSSFKELSDKLDDHVEDNSKSALETNLQVKRLELLQMMYQFPAKTSRIDSLYREYKSNGGNSYIDDVYCEWKDLSIKAKKRKVKNHE